MLRARRDIERATRRSNPPSLSARAARLTAAAASNIGTMPSPNWSTCRPVMPRGSTPCRSRWRGTATAEAHQAITDLDLNILAAIEPPRGYGRD
jgi:hypothetical protein